MRSLYIKVEETGNLFSSGYTLFDIYVIKVCSGTVGTTQCLIYCHLYYARTPFAPLLCVIVSLDRSIGQITKKLPLLPVIPRIVNMYSL